MYMRSQEQEKEGKMKLYFTPKAKIKLDLYIRLSDTEVSGVGRVTLLERGSFLVDDVFILEQECSWSETALDQEALARFLEEFVAKGERPSGLRLWWHSHRDWDVFWSRRDERTIRCFNVPWLISVVGNRRGDYLARLDVFEPAHLTRDKIPVDVYLEADEKEACAIKRQLEQKVRRKTYCYPVERHGAWYSDWYSDWWEDDGNGEEEAEDED